METVNDTRKTRLVFDYRVGRALLKRGNVVVDIKPNREAKDKCILIFENTEKFKADFDAVMSEFKAKQESNNEVDEPLEMED